MQKRHPFKTSQSKKLHQEKSVKDKSPVKLQHKKLKNGGLNGESKVRGKASGNKVNVAHFKTATHDDKDGKGGLVTKVLCWISNLIYNALHIRFLFG